MLLHWLLSYGMLAFGVMLSAAIVFLGIGTVYFGLDTKQAMHVVVTLGSFGLIGIALLGQYFDDEEDDKDE
ncbi:unnamed protein product [Vitrella brassicaformis CCMP3155]|uniref:Uncharacterized protein n=1 Tax=Vitrella brassicaformis (strain CCMP3155) TaxID=1169540 RepID=A0A0G4EBK4_VITBC|nr:unnamed protein product [Vitrella brassicaformis CCMP3155]|eukprot:CEL92679.1 unnamed protein product [Vitrella brassicaformis CCMP3155]